MKHRINRKGTDRKYIVYMLMINNNVFYIGKTSLKLEDRLSQHIKTNKKLIKKFKKELHNIIIAPVEECTDNFHLAEREVFWIKHFKQHLTNSELLNHFHCTNRVIPKKYLNC